jgi:D-inositol-3-phosphate glycosyltransferase
MVRIALLSFHGCPVARLGEKDTGGMNVYVLQIAKEFGLRGHQVDVYTRFHDPKDPQIVELGEGARVVHIKAGPYDETKETLYQYIPEFLSNLNTFQKSEGLEHDIIHSHYWFSARIGMTLSGMWNVPHVTTFHTLARTKLMARVGEQETRLRASVEKRAMEKVDAIIVFIDQERDDIARLYQTSPHKVEVIPAGVDLKLFRPLDKIASKQALGLSEKRVILYVGRVEPIKGIDILLRAVANLECTKDTELLIVGGNSGRDTEKERLQALSVELGIEDIVTFTGPVKQALLPTYYSAADVFVLPSYSESFGLVALESMACGTPVVVSRVGGLKTFVKNGETGYLIPWRCPEPFAQRLDMLLANPDLREAMGKAARARALEMSWSGVAERMIGFYSSLLEEVWESAAGA